MSATPTSTASATLSSNSGKFFVTHKIYSSEAKLGTSVGDSNDYITRPVGTFESEEDVVASFQGDRKVIANLDQSTIEVFPNKTLVILHCHDSKGKPILAWELRECTNKDNWASTVTSGTLLRERWEATEILTIAVSHTPSTSVRTVPHTTLTVPHVAPSIAERLNNLKVAIDDRLRNGDLNPRNRKWMEEALIRLDEVKDDDTAPVSLLTLLTDSYTFILSKESNPIFCDIETLNRLIASLNLRANCATSTEEHKKLHLEIIETIETLKRVETERTDTCIGSVKMIDLLRRYHDEIVKMDAANAVAVFQNSCTRKDVHPSTVDGTIASRDYLHDRIGQMEECLLRNIKSIISTQVTQMSLDTATDRIVSAVRSATSVKPAEIKSGEIKSSAPTPVPPAEIKSGEIKSSETEVKKTLETLTACHSKIPDSDYECGIVRQLLHFIVLSLTSPINHSTFIDTTVGEILQKIRNPPRAAHMAVTPPVGIAGSAIADNAKLGHKIMADGTKFAHKMVANAAYGTFDSSHGATLVHPPREARSKHALQFLKGFFSTTSPSIRWNEGRRQLDLHRQMTGSDIDELETWLARKPQTPQILNLLGEIYRDHYLDHVTAEKLFRNASRQGCDLAMYNVMYLSRTSIGERKTIEKRLNDSGFFSS